ncbi:uncharacterized protein BDR25DRAFT_1236 [Lindgomyces ingoldianus]|uniref:Uncharacterized protein n=1 Tax=Lindgomyces ingoldianus TaxID=673940 RepID=A0ACB6RGL4_9PLEO|nr:uncharacterized protein BDR25DRAFT_1236 [Lindgomyces ingoldianus]KAF2477470.1 hypothetical protein BDR25DRAFT_1236 [Lindgomyces ingoldianus]
MAFATKSLFGDFITAIAFFVLLAQTAASDFTVSYCSSQNTGSGSEDLVHIWQSNGWCHDKCVDVAAFAVVQNQSCWCSDYIPANQQDTGDCNEDCPGFPDEKCGNQEKGLFGYIALEKKPSGTQSASQPSVTKVSTPPVSASSQSPSSSAAPSSDAPSSEPTAVSSRSPSLLASASIDITASSRSSIHILSQFTFPYTQLVARSTISVGSFSWISLSPSAPPSPVSSAKETHQNPETVVETVTASPPVVTLTPSAPGPAATTFKTTASSVPSQAFVPTPITSVQTLTVSGVVVTQTVVSSAGAAPALTDHQKKGTPIGAIVGGVIGGLVFLVLLGLLAFFLMRRRKLQQDGGQSGVQRNTSTMSRSGLLAGEKLPAIHTNVKRNSRFGVDNDSISPISGSDRRNSRPYIYDQRLNPSAMMTLDNVSRASVVSLDDGRDYGRTLNVTNPDPDPHPK